MSSTLNRRTAAVGVVIPVHNEETLLPAALEALGQAFVQLESADITSGACVVLDSCTDQSEEIALTWQRGREKRRGRFEVRVLTSDQRNVGVARAMGCDALLERWKHVNPSRIWIATTDADSRVPSEWLGAQIHEHEEGADLWSGRVAIVESSAEREATVAQWRGDYEVEVQPIHGTSLGFNAAVYRAVGGFPPLATGEDRALRQSLVALGARVHYNSSVRVVTSARRNARSPLGFAHALDVIEASLPSSARN